jgi:hypothetical protein
MSTLNFPSSPSLNDTYSVGYKTWIWNGYAWDLQLANTDPIFAQANAAFDKANTDVTSISVGSGTYGNATFVPVLTIESNGRISSVSTIAIEGGGGGGSGDSTVRANSEVFVANGSTSTFTLSLTDIIGKANNSIVTVDGLTQIPGVQYNVATNSITFSTTPTANSLIEVRLFEVVDACSVIEIREYVPGNSFFTAVSESSNSAFDKANTANVLAQASFDKANTDVTSISVGSGTYGNSTTIPVITLSSNGRVSAVSTATIQPTNYTVQTFVAPGTYTKPTGLKHVKITVVGGGSGGAGTRANPPPSTAVSRGGGGGGGGGTAISWISAPVIAGPVAVTVGTGGAGGAAPATNGTWTNGTPGGTSSFGEILSATGGNGGTGNAGAGGLGSGGTLNIGGGGGGNGTIVGPAAGASSGAGGPSTLGGGGSAVFTGGAGQPAGNYGAGGSGGASTSTAGQAGGNGSGGIVIVEEFY